MGNRNSIASAQKEIEKYIDWYYLDDPVRYGMG